MGLLSLYTPAGAPLSVERIAKYLEKVRSSFGTGLSLDELVVLEAPFFLDRGAGRATPAPCSRTTPGSREA